MAITKIPTELIDTTSHMDFLDGEKLRLGTSNDLQIYHDGTHSYLASSTGSLYARTGNTFQIENQSGSEDLATFAVNGAVTLYYDGSAKLATTNSGVTVTGDISGTTATAAGGTSTTALASTAFVQQELTTLIGGAPSTLNDLNELAAAINDDANYNSTLTTALATKLPLAGGTMSGTLNITQASTNDTIKLTRGTTSHNNMIKFRSAGADKWILGQRNDSTEHFRLYSYGTSTDVLSILTDGKVGIGISNPGATVHADASGGAVIRVTRLSASSSAYGQLEHDGTSTTLRSTGELKLYAGTNVRSRAAIHTFANVAGTTEYGRFDSSGNLLVGTTSTSIATTSSETGTQITDGGISIAANNPVAQFNRISSDGAIVNFRKDGATVGSIGTLADRIYFAGANEAVGIDDSWNAFVPLDTNGGNSNGDTDLGNPSSRFKDLWLSGISYTNKVVAQTIYREGSDGSGLHFTTNAIYPTNQTSAISDATETLGAAAYRFKDFYLSGTAYIAGTTGRGLVLSNATESYTDNVAVLNAQHSQGILQFKTASTERMRIDKNGNLGFGETPNANWSSSYRAIDAFGGATFQFEANSTRQGQNFYGYPWKYKATRTASSIAHTSGGDISFQVAPSGTADSAITWSQAMLIKNGGNVGIGTPNPTAKLDVVTNDTVWAGEFTQSNTSNGDGVIVTVGSTASADYAFSVRSNAGNTSGLAVKADGNVGIGTFSPTNAKLEVVATSGEVFRADSASGAYRIVANQTGVNMQGTVSVAGKITASVTDSQFHNRLFIKNGTHGLYMGQWDTVNHRIEADANRPLTIQSYNSGGITLGISGNSKLVVTNAGVSTPTKLAVMSSSPHGSYDFYNNGTSYFNGATIVDATLQINNDSTDAYSPGSFLDYPTMTLKHPAGNGYYNGTRVTNNSGNYEWFYGATQTSGNEADFVFQGYDRSGGGYKEMLRIQDSGNVGIGTNNPTVPLDVYGAGWGGIDIDGASGGELRFQKAGSTYGQIFASNSHGLIINAQGGLGDIFFQSSGVTKMTMLDSGSVGIGTSSPAQKLHIKDTSTTGGILLTRETSNAGAYLGVKYQHSPSDSSFYAEMLFRQVDTNHGGQIEFWTDNSAGAATQRMTINKSGNVDISGTANVSNTLTAGALTIPSQGMIFNQAFGTGVPSITMTGTANNGRAGAINFKESDGSGGAIANTAAIYSTDGVGGNANYGGLTIAAYQSDIRFSTGTLAGTKMIIRSDGKVGIGPGIPTTELQVSGASDSRVLIYETGASPYTATLELSSQAIGTYGAIVQYTSAAERLTIQNYGRAVSAGSSTGSIAFKTKVSNTTPTDVMFIHGFTGNVGIGTGTNIPDNPLEVVGADSGIKISSAANNRPHLRFECGSDEKLRLSANAVYGAIGDSSDTNRYMIFKDGALGYGGNTGVYEKYFSGTVLGNATVSHDITHTSDASIGTILRVEAAMTHHPSYDCILDTWVSRRGSNFTHHEQFRRDTGFSGAWSVTYVSSTVTRITKSAGTYGGGGPYWIKVTWRNV